RPIAGLIIQIARAILQENVDRLARIPGFSDLARINVAAADVGETADVTQDFAEQVRPLPRHGERADASGANAANRAAYGVVPEVVLLLHCGQDFLFQETGVLVRQRVVLIAAFAGLLGRVAARIDEDADRDRHFFLVDEIVKDGRHAEATFWIDVAP